MSVQKRFIRNLNLSPIIVNNMGRGTQFANLDTAIVTNIALFSGELALLSVMRLPVLARDVVRSVKAKCVIDTNVWSVLAHWDISCTQWLHKRVKLANAYVETGNVNACMANGLIGAGIICPVTFFSHEKVLRMFCARPEFLDYVCDYLGRNPIVKRLASSKCKPAFVRYCRLSESMGTNHLIAVEDKKCIEKWKANAAIHNGGHAYDRKGHWRVYARMIEMMVDVGEMALLMEDHLWHGEPILDEQLGNYIIGKSKLDIKRFDVELVLAVLKKFKLRMGDIYLPHIGFEHDCTSEDVMKVWRIVSVINEEIGYMRSFEPSIEVFMIEYGAQRPGVAVEVFCALMNEDGASFMELMNALIGASPYMARTAVMKAFEALYLMYGTQRDLSWRGLKLFRKAARYLVADVCKWRANSSYDDDVVRDIVSFGLIDECAEELINLKTVATKSVYDGIDFEGLIKMKERGLIGGINFAQLFIERAPADRFVEYVGTQCVNSEAFDIRANYLMAKEQYEDMRDLVVRYAKKLKRETIEMVMAHDFGAAAQDVVMAVLGRIVGRIELDGKREPVHLTRFCDANLLMLFMAKHIDLPTMVPNEMVERVLKYRNGIGALDSWPYAACIAKTVMSGEALIEEYWARAEDMRLGGHIKYAILLAVAAIDDLHLFMKAMPLMVNSLTDNEIKRLNAFMTARDPINGHLFHI